MSIWNINNIEFSASGNVYTPKEIRLWKNEKGSFTVIEQGDYLSILDGPDYTLIKKKYSPIFRELIDQATLHPAIIYDTVLKSNNNEYVELLSFKTITPETIKNEDSSGLKVWTYKGSLFVSDDLKSIIQQQTMEEFNFHLGFETWGG